MENNTQKKSAMSSKLWLIIGILALVAIVVVLATAFEKKEVVDSPVTVPGDQQLGEEVLGDDLTNNRQESNSVVPGGNPVVDGQVVNIQGDPVRTDVRPMDINAPRQTGPVSSEELTEEVIQLEISAAGWSPSEFTVVPGSLITLSVTSVDTSNHTFRFRDASLNAVRVGVYGGETRAISFNAPNESGEYEFYCDVPGHARRGEIGKMIVQ
jgi:plastocyanin